MSWNKTKVNNHKKAAELLGKIKNETLRFIQQNPSTYELDVQEFILQKFEENNLKNEVAKPIVAFRENTSHVHYFADNKSNKKLKKESLILVDLWARLRKSKAPYADITWMAYYGYRPPKKILKAFREVVKARNEQIKFIESQVKQDRLPTGGLIDLIGREIIDSSKQNSSQEKRFLHGTGHELGTTSPHGRGRPINQKNEHPIKIEMGYTIEPGLYIKGEFGVRSEINFYIDKKKSRKKSVKWDKRLIITTPKQKSLTKIKP